MGYKSDIEIAQETPMLPITEIAKKAGIDDKYLEQYGKYKAKIDYNLLRETDAKDGKLILVTAINPTPAGEGKTTTTVGLADAMQVTFDPFRKGDDKLNNNDVPIWEKYTLTIEEAAKYFRCSKSRKYF